MFKLQHRIADTSPQEPRTKASHINAELIRSYGSHALAVFGLAPQNVPFLTPGGEGLVNYRLVSNVAVVLEDPVCAAEAFAQVTRSVFAFSAVHVWDFTLYQ